MRKHLLTISLLLAVCTLQAQPDVPVETDSTRADTVLPTRKQGVVRRLLAYFEQSNKGKDHEKFDFSSIGGPHYETGTKLG